MQRIPKGQSGKVPDKPPVLLQHGLLMVSKNSANYCVFEGFPFWGVILMINKDATNFGLWQDGITWMLNPPDQSLAFILADNGFDVWLANTRGTRYSRGHTTLSPNKSVYL